MAGKPRNTQLSVLRFCKQYVHFFGPEIHIFSTCRNRVFLQRAGAACTRPLKGRVWSSLLANASDRKDSFSTATGARIDQAHQPTHAKKMVGQILHSRGRQLLPPFFFFLLYKTRCTYWVHRETILDGSNEEGGGAWQRLIRGLGSTTSKKCRATHPVVCRLQKRYNFFLG
jgi:hypothetical protein